MNWVTQLSIVYALVNMSASYGLNFRHNWGPYAGCVGALLGFGVGLHSVDAKGLMLNTPIYFIFGVLAIRRNRQRQQQETANEA